MIKAVIFDLDGTLLDTRKDLADSINLVLKDLNKKQKEQSDIIKNVGHGIRYLIEKTILPNTTEEMDKASALFKKHYSKLYNNSTTVYKGIKEAVNMLIEQGILVGVVSNKDDEYVQKLIEYHFNRIDRNYVLGGKPGLKKKPSSEPVDQIIDKMGIKKEEVIYVGDSMVDVETSQNASIYNIICLWGFSDRELMIKNCKHTIEDPQDILKYIKEKNNA